MYIEMGKPNPLKPQRGDMFIAIHAFLFSRSLVFLFPASLHLCVKFPLPFSRLPTPRFLASSLPRFHASRITFHSPASANPENQSYGYPPKRTCYKSGIGEIDPVCDRHSPGQPIALPLWERIQ